MRSIISRILVIFVAVIAAGFGTQQAAGGPAPQVIVLGDSIAAGCCVSESQEWATIFAQQLGVDLNNVGVGGANSSSLINQDRLWPSGRTQPQLDEAVSLLGEAAPGSVIAVTLDIGGNDLLGLSDPDSGLPCFIVTTPACNALVVAAIPAMQANIHTILTALLAAMEPGVPMLVMTYYNPLDDGTEIGDVIEPAILLMNGVILAEIAEHSSVEIDAHAYFAGRSVELISGDNIHPSKAGHALLADLFTNAVGPDSDGDGLADVMEAILGANPAVQDSDQDGCSDGQEFGPDEKFGGRRNPNYFWDFYDTWTAPPGNPSGWERNAVINLFDILAVGAHFGPGGTSEKTAALAAALTPPTSGTGYHASYDRSANVGPNHWDKGPADGHINVVDDILAVAGVFGHSCA